MMSVSPGMASGQAAGYFSREDYYLRGIEEGSSQWYGGGARAPSRMRNSVPCAVMVGMSVHWLRRKRWEGGGIPFIKMSQRGAVRYEEETVRQYLDAHFRTSTHDPGRR